MCAILKRKETYKEAHIKCWIFKKFQKYLTGILIALPISVCYDSHSWLPIFPPELAWQETATTMSVATLPMYLYLNTLGTSNGLAEAGYRSRKCSSALI